MDELIGVIKQFGGNFAPVGYLDCNGQLLKIADQHALYSILGTAYGGDGKNTFALPDLRTPKSQDPVWPPGTIRYIICVDGAFPQQP